MGHMILIKLDDWREKGQLLRWIDWIIFTADKFALICQSSPPRNSWTPYFPSSDRSGLKFLYHGRVGSTTSGLGKFPLKIPNCSIFLLWIKKISSGRVKKYTQVKDRSAPYSLRVKSVLGSGLVRARDGHVLLTRSKKEANLALTLVLSDPTQWHFILTRRAKNWKFDPSNKNLTRPDTDQKFWTRTHH